MTEISQIENLDRQVKLITHALDQVSAVFKLDEIQRNELIQRIDKLEKENFSMKKEIQFLKTHTHNLFW